MTLDARMPHAIRKSALLLCCLAAAAASGCATDKLALAPPAGVDLSGSWVFDTNLSDDPSQLETLEPPAQAAHDAESNTTPTAFGKPGQNGPNNPLSAGSTSTLFGDSAPTDTVVQTVDDSALVEAPETMTIQQQGPLVRILTVSASGKKGTKSYTAGTIQSIPWPGGGAQCHSGWRGPAFVVTTRPKKGRERENDYALDDEGHLIMTIQARKLDVKLVYDRQRI